MGRLALVLWLAALPLRAEVYRWTDEQGQVHFGDRPPVAGLESVEINPNVSGSKGLRSGERELLKRIRAREAHRRRARVTEAPERTGPTATERRRCAGYRLRLGDHQAERRGGCSAARCAALDRRMEHFRRLLADECG